MCVRVVHREGNLQFQCSIFLKFVQDVTFQSEKKKDVEKLLDGVFFQRFFNDPVIKSVTNFVKFVPIITVRDKLSGLKVKDNRKQYMGCSIW